MTAVSPELIRFAASRNASPPLHLGTRYNETGSFLAEPGNTVVCHLAGGSATERALAAAREKYLAMPEAGDLIFTPLSSLHMTLFQGIIEYRRKPGFWPADVSLETPIEEMTEIMGERLAGFPVAAPFGVAVTATRPTGLVVEGATADDRAAMQAWRDAFAELWGYRHPDHESYVFHVTFAYPVRWLDDTALPAWQAMLDEVAATLRAEVPVLELRPPAFCAFNDMNHFEELLALPVAG
ncbi:MAG: DUF1868 domain-containing protein [Devosia sp.]|nr:DUF1868 domain-containing protein [Devosia sp.]